MNDQANYEALRQRYLRLRIAALAVVDEARAVGTRERVALELVGVLDHRTVVATFRRALL
jgi:hypothetical protein